MTKGERTRLQLLEVAAAEFAERGFQHTRISDIVARAGVTQPVFYQYFAGKQAAYDELVGMFAQRLRQEVCQARLYEDQQNLPVEERVRRGVTNWLGILQEDRNLTRIGFFQVDAAEALKDELVEMISENIRIDQRAGVFRKDIPPDWLSHAFMGVIERFTRREPNAEEREALADFITTMFLQGVLQR
ncbi:MULTISPECIES: TetR/AcrR family transcriptional regulator [Achromobacter]|uniref:HTH tetR-type domain-containing protein n=2 Tax=Achromobacter TaxID=222 RepID=A0A6S7CL28_9BURK|nr:TetR/AcrR family transcriptional regulator [Achromobacter ruhlandii]AOU93329.1 TetR family transcriptional regulator [Achromobacter ruhlandii]MCI1835939.1 TetR/AcrR family transcriptional regulator [Achromobacter ruhlandii]MCV6798393.1 TetR/AcrR family transcriptional regulator [Achromobacter ruhlandii]MCV6803823.1 TetR/AcrR family transcriptional regulator [Achromobacter ruhlandii]MCV6810142.1 TetR/AcrR family transcriptional regulator [Achromobacter ruhlandii]